MSLSLPVCELSNSVLESELREAAIQDVIASVEILEAMTDVAPSYFVAVQMHWSGKKVWYLTTRRDRTRPRLFRQVSVVLELLRSVSSASITLRLNNELPASHPSSPKSSTNSRALSGS